MVLIACGAIYIYIFQCAHAKKKTTVALFTQQEAGLDPNANQWQAVQDFGWLRVDVQSPNWAIIPVSERLVTWRTS